MWKNSPTPWSGPASHVIFLQQQTWYFLCNGPICNFQQILPLLSTWCIWVRCWDFIFTNCSIDYTVKCLFFALIHPQDIYDKLSCNNSSLLIELRFNPLSVSGVYIGSVFEWIVNRCLRLEKVKWHMMGQILHSTTPNIKSWWCLEILHFDWLRAHGDQSK